VISRLAYLPLFFGTVVAAAQEGPDYTTFQAAAPYAPEIDIASDVVMVYGMRSFDRRVAEWRANDYDVSMMTGISWGNYGDYYGGVDNLKVEEIQTTAGGDVLMHGNSKTVGYNVPSPDYIDYIKRLVEPAVDAGVRAVFLEEPEFWARAGWSEGFRQEWQRYYGTPWEPPDSSVDAQYKASRLKYELYYEALSQVFKHVKGRAAEQGRDIECHVPTHTLVNYANWRIVSPMTHLMDLPEVDGYIAQVWTGTARTPNLFAGKMRERTFETAYLEYASAWAMVRPTGRKVWFLADPIEDNPNYTWEDYRLNYEATIVASLLFPEVHRFEVMPWPNRIFRGTYPKEMDSDDREGIPEDYAVEILTVINALNDMKQEHNKLHAGERGIGIVISDTLMFQRAAPDPSDSALGHFFGLALPLLKRGIPVELVHLETVKCPDDLAEYRALLLSYEGQKPLQPAYHDYLKSWLEGGGTLLYVGDGSDPYHGVKEWWNDHGKRDRTARDALLETLGVEGSARPQAIGKGRFLLMDLLPSKIARHRDGGARLLRRLANLLDVSVLETSPHLLLERGPYRIASVFDEVDAQATLTLPGSHVSLFDPRLEVVDSPSIAPGERGVWVALDALGRDAPAVVACSSRLRDSRTDEAGFHVTTRGPVNTPCRMRIYFPERPGPALVEEKDLMRREWDEASSTLFIEYPNLARNRTVTFPPPDLPAASGTD